MLLCFFFKFSINFIRYFITSKNYYFEKIPINLPEKFWGPGFTQHLPGLMRS